MFSLRTLPALALAGAAIVAPAGVGSAHADRAKSLRIVGRPLPGVSAGRVAGTRAFVALSLHRGRLRAYICDGTLKRRPTVARWLRARWDGRSPLTVAAGRVKLRIEHAAGHGRMSGHVVLAGRAHAFRARPARAPAGLYDGRARGTRATWIALDKKHLRGTFVPTRPPRCRVVMVTGADGTVRYVSLCG
jgi:hypothetical protein